MLIGVGAIAMGLLLVGGLDTSAQETAFTRYPPEPSLQGSPAKPQMVLPRARQFQTVLRNEASQGPSFNGHYRVATWGCGTTCINWAIIDLTDGKIWFAEKPAYPCEPDDTELGLEMSLTSRLFYLYQCVPGSEGGHSFNGRHIYEWHDGRPRLLRIEPYQRKEP